MKINKEWHGKNRTPKNPSVEERIKWHLKHSQKCVCWPIPEKLKVEIQKRKIKK